MKTDTRYRGIQDKDADSNYTIRKWDNNSEAASLPSENFTTSFAVYAMRDRRFKLPFFMHPYGYVRYDEFENENYYPFLPYMFSRLIIAKENKLMEKEYKNILEKHRKGVNGHVAIS